MFDSEYCLVEYLAELDAVFCRWKKVCSLDDYRAPLLFGLDLLVKKKVKNWITDTRGGFHNIEEDSQWLVEEFIPRTINSSCESIFFVLQEGSPLKGEIEGQVKALSEFFHVLVFEDCDMVVRHIKNSMKEK